MVETCCSSPIFWSIYWSHRSLIHTLSHMDEALDIKIQKIKHNLTYCLATTTATYFREGAAAAGFLKVHQRRVQIYLQMPGTRLLLRGLRLIVAFRIYHSLVVCVYVFSILNSFLDACMYIRQCCQVGDLTWQHWYQSVLYHSLTFVFSNSADGTQKSSS